MLTLTNKITSGQILLELPPNNFCVGPIPPNRKLAATN